MDKEDILESTIRDKNKCYKSLVNLIIEKHNVKQMNKIGMMSAFLADQRIEDLNIKIKNAFDNHCHISKIFHDLISPNNK